MKISVKILPNAKKSEIIGFEDEFLKIKIAAPAQDGKANAELAQFLAKTWGLKKKEITLMKGKTARLKILEVPDQVSCRLDMLKNLFLSK